MWREIGLADVDSGIIRHSLSIKIFDEILAEIVSLRTLTETAFLLPIGKMDIFSSFGLTFDLICRKQSFKRRCGDLNPQVHAFELYAVVRG